MNNLVELFGYIVDNVRLEWDTTNTPPEKPYYLYGHPKEIFNILAEKSRAEKFKYKRYPLVALFQGFKEEYYRGTYTAKNITIVIMTETDKSYRAPNRYENTFTPTLLPLYELLIKHLKYNRFLNSDNGYKHEKFDHLYWGEGNQKGTGMRVGNDALDAVVISGLDLRIKNCIRVQV